MAGKGRKTGVKNMVKTEAGNLVNQYGVEFTPEEKKALVSAVNTATRKRKRMLDEWSALPRKIGGRDTGMTNEGLKTMGKESDFIITKKTKSLQRFRSHEDYETYMENLRRVNQRDYVKNRVELYRENYIKSIEEAYGKAESKDIVKKLRGMSTKEYIKAVEQDETLEISYVYESHNRTKKLNKIRGALGIKKAEFDELPY